MSNQVYSSPGKIYKDILMAKYIVDSNGTVYEITNPASNGDVLQVVGSEIQFKSPSGPVVSNPVIIGDTTLSDTSGDFKISNVTGENRIEGTQENVLILTRSGTDVTHVIDSSTYYRIYSPSRIIMSCTTDSMQLNGGPGSVVRAYNGDILLTTLNSGNVQISSSTAGYTDFLDTADVTASSGTGKYRFAGGVSSAKTIWSDKMRTDTETKCDGDLYVQNGGAPINDSYKSDAVSITWTGPWASDQVSSYYVRRVQNVVQLTLVGVQASASNPTYITNTGFYLPAEYRPIVDTEFYCRIINNIQTSGVFGRVYTTGEIRIYATDAGGNFGISGNAGVFSISPSFCC